MNDPLGRDNETSVGRRVAKKAFKKALKKAPPQVKISVKLVKLLMDGVEDNQQKRLAYVRKLEKKLGSSTTDQIGLVISGFDFFDPKGGVTSEAVQLVSNYRVCAWKAPNSTWVYHTNEKYRPCYKVKTTKIYRPTGQRMKDGSWGVSESPA